MHCPGSQAHRGQHVAGARVVGQVELDVVGARALAQAGEESAPVIHARRRPAGPNTMDVWTEH